MEKIRINMTLDADSDADLYHYLINMAARRRATLLRALAMQGLNGDHQLRSGITKTVKENKPELPKPVIKDEQIIISDEKQKAFSNAFDDMMTI
jgi:hypothetical protein